ncbi:MAG: T9SS type A sorting domain-containing protein [Saprospiraceae bacterium]
MKKILILIVLFGAFLNSSFATGIGQGTIKKIDNNILGVFFKMTSGDNLPFNTTPNMNITVTLPISAGIPNMVATSPINGGSGISINALPPILDGNGRRAWVFILTGTVPSNLWTAPNEYQLLQIVVSGGTPNGSVARLHDYSDTGGGSNGQAFFDIGWNGFYLTNYASMFFGTNVHNVNGGESYVDAPAPLPVTLVSFKADKFQDRSSHLTWATASESNSSHFLVQSSTDKKSWKNLGSVKAAGNSQLIENYEYFDYNVYNGRDSRLTVYYRLQMVDLDGQVKTSPVEAVVFGNGIAPGRDFVVYPNPASDGVQVEWDANRIDQPTSLEFFDVTGKLVYTQKVSDNTNQEYIDFGHTTITPGLYLLRILNGEEPLDFKQIVVGQR